MLGESITHYRIESKLGEGGMGIVYKAFDTRLLRPVALKILPSHLVADERSLLRFTQEAQAASALNHPNICTIHDIDEQDGIHFIVMELVEGETLRQTLERRGPLPEPEVIAIGMKVADALQAAHAKGIIHRDLKPENIMISRAGYVKVMDFGLAKLQERETVFGIQASNRPHIVVSLKSSANTLQGTAAYMAPEQIDNSVIDGRTDIFSLGVVFYELLAGALPFVGLALTDIMKSILDDTPKDLCEVNPNCSPAMASIVKRTLAKSPEARYQSAQELLANLEALQKHEIHSPFQPRKYTKDKGSRLKPNRAWQVRIGIAALLLVALFLGYQFLLRPPEPSTFSGPRLTAVAVLEFVNVTGKTEDQYLARGLWEDLLLRLSRVANFLAMPAAGKMPGASTLDEHKVGAEYKADYVLRGRVEHRHDSLRVVLDLFDLAAKNVTWSQAFERKAEDIFGLQQELAESAALAMKITLSQRDRDKLIARPTSSPAAYAYYLRGRDYFARHYEANYNFAIALYKKALQIDPTYALAYAGLGEAYLALYDWYMRREASLVDTARICIEKALAIDPNLPEAHAAYGDLHRLQGADKIPQAIAEYLVAIRLNPNQAEALFHLTRLHREAGNFEEAVIWGKKCLQIQPMNAEVCIEMALVSWFEGFREEATRYFDRAIEMEPDHPISYGQKAFFAFCNGQWDQAKALYQRNLELDPRSSQALGALARIAFGEGQVDKSISLYKQLLSMGADGIDYFNLGQIYLSKDDFAAANVCRDSALAVSQRFLQKNPRDHRWLSDLAIAYAAKGDAALALEYIAQAKQTRDFQANFIRKNRVLLREAMVFSLLGKNDEALATLQQLLSLRMYAPEYFRRYIGLENVRRDPRFAKLMDADL